MFENIALALALFTITSQSAPTANSTSPPNPINPFQDPSNCSLSTSYETANASFSYSIASVGISKNSIDSQDPLHSTNWTLSTTISQSPADSRFRTRQDFWLDTSSTLSPNSTSVPWNGCVTVFKGLAQSVSEQGQNDDGSCSSLLGKECATALQDQFRAAARGVSDGDRRQSGAEACMSVAGAAMMVPPSCRSKTGLLADEGWGLVMSSGIPNFTPLSTSNCTSSSNSSTSPRLIIGTSSTLALPAGNFSVYDQWASSVTPVLLSMWSNSTTDGQVHPWADTRLVCARPKNIGGGSRAPAPLDTVHGGARDGNKSAGGKVDVGRGAWAAMALGVVAVWMVVWV
ncbi:MAG: hypothetical protein M1812_007253 [Candelaria pacifica]|nr:MAG: hypothetical protein M1812_007253 [Candelaria pacifica]